MVYARIAGVDVGDAYPVRIMAVINVSPESFYSGSIFTKPDEIAEVAERFEREGANFIDVGGRSTAPYKKTDIPLEEELRRVITAIKYIKENTSIKIPISVDTTSSIVAEKALEVGASIVNDVRGLKGDLRMAKVVAEYDVPVIICAYKDVVSGSYNPVHTVIEALTESLEIASKHSIDLSKVVIDPAIGFFRPKDYPWYIWDSVILKSLKALRVFNKPILVGVSRKSFIGAITGKKRPEERLWGSLAATAIAVYNGAHIVRTHDPKETRDAVMVAKFIRDVSS